MAKRKCPEGQQWDILLNTCYSWPVEPRAKPQPPTDPVLMAVDQLRTKISTSNAPTLPTALVLSQTLWICVVLVTLGSILVLTLWLVLFRRQTRVMSNLEQEFQNRTEPPVNFPSRHSDINLACQRGEEAPSPRQHLHPWDQTESECEDGFTVGRGPERHGSTGGGGGPPACSAAADHRVPLPATELWGTALVTTKTL